MKKFLPIVGLLTILISACAAQATPAPTLVSSPAPTFTNTLPPTATIPPATPTPSPTPTALPVNFDLNGFRDFALLKNYFDDFETFKQDQSISTLSTYMSQDGSKLAISGCHGALWSNFDCATSKSGFLIVMDLPSGAIVNEIPLGNHWAGQVMISSDNKTMLFSTNEQKVILWDLTTNKEIKTFMTQDRTTYNKYPDVAISPDNNFYAGALNGFVYVWDADGKQLAKLPVYQAHISSGLVFSADSSMLAFFGENRDSVMVYNTADWTIKQKLPLDAAWGIDFSPDGRYIGAVNADKNTVKIWQVSDGQEVTELKPNLREVSITFSPKSDLLFVIGAHIMKDDQDYTSIGEIYETQNWTKLEDFHSFEDLGKVQFSKDGSVMTIVNDFAIQLWGKPDDMLKAGIEKEKRFQQALADGDYDLAASLFTVDDNQKGYLTNLGVDLNDLPDSFAKLCQAKTILCYPIKDIVMMGNNWNYMQYIVRLQKPDGEIYTSTDGVKTIFLYARPGENGEPALNYLPRDR
jgi:hypothetical protein